MRLNPRDINCKFNGFHFHPSRLAQKLPGVSILSAKYLKQIVIYIVSESQRRENYADLSSSLMKTIRTLGKLQRGLKGQEVGKAAKKVVEGSSHTIVIKSFCAPGSQHEITSDPPSQGETLMHTVFPANFVSVLLGS